MINLNIYPRHLSRDFLDLFQGIVTQRLEAKKAGDKAVADALKIVVNSVYGKLNFEYGWMYDTEASYTVTLTGQLFLLMLVEMLEANKLEVFYANTDGLTVKVPRDKRDTFDAICDSWQKYTDLELEFANYKKAVIRDVNNYVIEVEGKDPKSKGAFVTEIDMTKGYKYPVVPKAVHEYFINGTPIEETIKNHDNIYDFCISQKVGNQFTTQYKYLDLENLQEITEVCQKTNRYFVSNSGGKLYKVKYGENPNDLVAGYNVTMFNDYFEAEDYDINYGYYITQARKIVDTMEPKQLSLF